MNIVKGVADLIRRTSNQTGESNSESRAERFPAPSPRICFSDTGDEAILSALWENYEHAVDKEEKKKLLRLFLKQFLLVFKNWEPLTSSQLSEVSLFTTSTLSHGDNTVIGCSIGHPAEIVHILIEEISQLTVTVAEMNVNIMQSLPNMSGTSVALNVMYDWVPVLDAFTIVIRSMHNCKVLGYYGGIQKLTALLKAAVVQLKTMTGALSADESLSNLAMENTRFLQRVLVYVVSIICSFIELDPNVYQVAQLYSKTFEVSTTEDHGSLVKQYNLRIPFLDRSLQWHPKAVVSVMEAGGLNWLVELVRVIRRLSMKEQWTDLALQYLSFRTLRSALWENPRGQNHFRSIGGLEVLLDGPLLPSRGNLMLKNSSFVEYDRNGLPLTVVFQLHILSLEVLREAVFGSLNNLQFLCENGRVHKFANSLCSLAFMLQEYMMERKVRSIEEVVRPSASGVYDLPKEFDTGANESGLSPPLCSTASCLQTWRSYVAELSRTLCSFMLTPECNRSGEVPVTTGSRSVMPTSSSYGELSLKWVMRVLFMMFPCIRAFSDQSVLPSHLRIFVTTFQKHVLGALRKVLALSAASLEILREEGLWDLIFSENFFYFRPCLEDSSGVLCKKSGESPTKHGTINLGNRKVLISGVEELQMEIISFVEFTASLNGSSHNMPECSAFLDALEQSACNPELASILGKSLLAVLQASTEKSVASFMKLDAVPRILKIVCIQAQEYRKSGTLSPNEGIECVVTVLSESDSYEMAQAWFKGMETLMELFKEFLLVEDDANNLVLHSSECIDCLFDLFWEERFRSRVLTHIHNLMKIIPVSEVDKKAKLQLCSKYLETFTQIKEREKYSAETSIELLVGMREMLLSNQKYYQDLFRDGECFLHVVSLLNGNLDEENAEKLVLNVLQTLTFLLASNDVSKAAFRSLVGKGYQTLQSLLLDFCQWQPNEGLLSALLDMLVDGRFDIKFNPVVKNEDVIMLYLSVLQKSSDRLQHNGLNIFQQLLKDSMSNRASCVRAGMLNFLLDWFSQEDDDSVILKIAHLIQVIGGHSISGKDIRKIFALLRSEKVGTRQHYCSLLLTSVLSMLNEKGPTAFFDMAGDDSGIKIETPLEWPLNRGYSFTCWLRVENIPRNGIMGLFSFLTESGKGCSAVLAMDKLIYDSINLKKQRVAIPVNLVQKKWHFLCLTHSIGRAFSGGSQLKCYVDGSLVTSDRCRYAKVNDLVTNCTVGARIKFPSSEEENATYSMNESSPFLGQIGPLYIFNDAITSEQVKGIYSLGPSYMYSFLDNEAALFCDPLPSGMLDAKDGLASKIIFGLNAQATNCRSLFNVSPMLENSVDKKSFKAMVLVGTQLCSRKLLQQTIYCVGGVSVFFPLISQSERYEDDNEDTVQSEDTLFIPISKERMTAEVIELIASVLDENLANQQQMHLLSGFSVLGFLLQSVPPQQLNLDTLSALKHMFSIVANCGWSDLLVEDAISRIFLNPVIWVYTVYKVQREVYLFLIQQFDNDPRLLKSMCRLPRVIDIVCQFYWDYSKSRSAISGKPLLHPITRKVIGERPNKEEIHKIRLLLLSLGEMSLRQNIQAADIKVLISFFETSQDMACIEDVLQMVIRAISQKTLLSSFLEEVNLLGGIQLFVNLLQRDHEPIRLLALQFLERLLVGLPSEKKGSRFFYLNVGRSKSLSESQRNISLRMQPIFLAISDRIFRFQQTDNLCAMLFDVLLGGASPKQVLQKHNQLEKQRTKTNDTHFFLPQFLVLIFRYLANCNNSSIRMKVISDILDLLDSNTSNIEALMEYGWSAWLAAFVKLDVMKNYRADLRANDANEHILVRNLFCVVLCHYLYSLKGGWQQLEETVNFLVLHCRQVGISCQDLLRDIYDDLFKSLLSLSRDENIFFMQPCRDNTLYLLKLVDETLLSEMDHNLPFPASGSEPSLDLLQSESQRDLSSALVEALRGESDDQKRSNSNLSKQPAINVGDHIDEKWWNFYDTVWIILSEMNGKGPSKTVPKSVASAGPSFGQRARGLVESLNIPAAEMAAVVVSGGISNALSGKPSKNVDKAMLLRGEKGPRIVYRLVILYICRSSLERASRCAQQVISLLPYFLSADDEHGKTKLQFFIWSLLTVRSQYGILNDAARFHVISHLIRETVNCGKSLLVSSIAGRDNLADSGSNSKESSTIHNLIQKDRVVAAVADEVKYIKDMKADRAKQLSELSIRMDESLAMESNLKKVFEDELHISLNTILASDDHRRAVFQLGHDEMQQNVAEKWIHMFRALIDERGPWSANPFPNRSVIHWKLDKTEDTWRRRQKLRRNYHFDEKLCFPPSTETFLPVAESKPGFGGHISKQMKQFLLKGVHRITDEGNSEPNDVDSDANGQHLISEDPSDSSSSEPLKDASDQRNIIQDRKDTSTSSTETETSEVLKSVQCIIVTPKRKLAGRLAVMKNVLHFFGEFLVEGTGGSSVFKNFGALSNSDSTKLNQLAGVQKQKLQRFSLRLDLESDNEIAEDGLDNFHENILKKQAKKVKRHRRWNICKIKAVHWTRYLLRYTAIEIFFHDSVAPVFLNFASQKDAKDVGTLIVATRNESFFPKGNYKEKNGAISFVDRHVALEIAEVTREKWRRREITNFDYLMILNTLSGRSYNDLTQYPVFPWILADYSSEALDFNKSSTFRDLSKPVGALDSKRFEVFDDRYRNFSDPDIPSFYYGSHYSSMGIVLYYLLRLEPFTALHRNLQGGKFDHADRLFQSIESTYRNCLSNTSDVKELIPEFFYMPEFLVNSNSYHLGVKQDGELLCDVCLPPWAKGSPEEFINRNREALESEYVSSNLHHWIDLVFGYKQRGKPAVEAANIFYYLTYEGAVDLDAMEDELQRSAIEDQIANFGQTPIQIFRKKHPRRGLPIPISHPLYFAPASINLTSTVSSTNHLPSALLYISLLDSNIVLVNQGLTMAVKMWLTTPLQSGGNLTFSGSQDPLFGIGYDILSPRKIGSPLAEGIDLGAQCFATLHTPAENFIISCGNWENSFQVISMGDGRMVQSIRQHKDVVSCVAVTSDGSVLATGSFDTTVMVWEVTRNKGLEKKARSAQIEVPRKDYVVQDAPFHILCAHDDVITCLYVSTELDIVISGSRDGTCVFHTLRGGRYVRSLCHPSGCALSKLVASRHGHVVFYAEDDLSLHLYSINGKHLATSESNGRLNCLELSCCGEFLVCAGDQGQIVVRAMNSLEVVRKYNGVGKVITSLTVTPEECFLVGTKDGTILVYSIENPQLRKSGPLRNAKSKAPNAG